MNYVLYLCVVASCWTRLFLHRPRLRWNVKKLMTVGSAYFLFAVINGMMRVVQEGTAIEAVFTSIPLAVIDVVIFCWISFSCRFIRFGSFLCMLDDTSICIEFLIHAHLVFC